MKKRKEKGKLVIYVDIDNTICTPILKKTAKERIKYCKPYIDMIKVINKLYDEGNAIIYYTHRHNYCERQTKLWMKKYKVKYDDIKFDKPGYDLLIDDKALAPSLFYTSKYLNDYYEMLKKWHFGKSRFRKKTKFKKGE